MQFKSNAKVTGATFFNDTIEGQKHDFTKIYIEMSLDDSRGTAKGFATQSMNWGTSDEYQKIKHLPFPFEAELTIELVTTGKSQKQRVVALRPLREVKPAPVAGA